MLHAPCSRRLAPCAAAVIFLALAAHAFAAEPAIVASRKLVRAGLAAHAAKNEKEFLSAMEAAVKLRPDIPRNLIDLAVAQVANNQADAAMVTLSKLADLGVASPIDREAGLAALRERPDFKTVVDRLTANAASVGDHDIGISLPDMTGLIEGIAAREKTGEFFFSDVHNRTIWARAKDGKMRRFTEPDSRLGAIFALAVDEPSGSLWATTSPLNAMSGFANNETDPAAGVVEFDLANGRIKRIVALPAPKEKHIFGDLTIAPDGLIYVTDSVAPVIWRLRPASGALEMFVESEEFLSLQGIAISADGAHAFVADYLNGLLRVDVRSGAVTRVVTPPRATLVGIDALVRDDSVSGRAAPPALIAVQNGLRPFRVVRLVLSPDGTAVTRLETLEAGHLGMGEPSLGTVSAGSFYVIGNAGWSRFAMEGAKPTAPRIVPVFRVKLVR